MKRETVLDACQRAGVHLVRFRDWDENDDGRWYRRGDEEQALADQLAKTRHVGSCDLCGGATYGVVRHEPGCSFGRGAPGYSVTSCDCGAVAAARSQR